MAKIGSIYSDAALRQYALWAGGLGPGGEGVLKYAWDASRSGSKMQATPLRPAYAWPLRPAVSSKFQSLPLRPAQEWVLRGRAQQGEEALLLVEPEPVAWPVILVGVMIGYIIGTSRK